MTPAILRRRGRVLRARMVAERLADAERQSCATACDAAQLLALRLQNETLLCRPADGRSAGAQLAATAALADRLRAASAGVERRQIRLDHGLTLARQVAQQARMDRRIAETLVDRATDAVEAALEARLAHLPRRRPANVSGNR